MYKSNSINLGVVALIVFLSLCNFLFGRNIDSILNGQIPSFLLLPLTILIALELRKSDFKVIVILIFIECLSVFAEYYLGVTTFFSSHEEFRVFDGSELFYFKRTLGLSDNSSIVAAKIFLGFLILEFIKVGHVRKWFFQGIFLIGIFLTFNRSVFVALAAFILLKGILNFITAKFTFLKWNMYVSIIISGAFAIGLFTLMNWDFIVGQLTRNTGTIELTGRDKIWEHYAIYIKDHFLLGNNSLKYFFGLYHAHNSFLQLIATNGILIALLYFYLIIRNITQRNIVYIIAIMTYCIFQFGIFWGISLMDIVFFFFLFRMRSEKNTLLD